MSSSASELNALGSTTVVDFYRPLLHPNASEAHQLLVSKLADRGVGRCRYLLRALCEPGGEPDPGDQHPGLDLLREHPRNFPGRILPPIRPREQRFSSLRLSRRLLVLVLFYGTTIGYLWYNVIGCVMVMVLAALLEQTLFRERELA